MINKIRIGNGFDFHRIQKNTDHHPNNNTTSQTQNKQGIMLAGTFIECPFCIIAHSDGDIIIHTLVDAILGALSLGDIGTYFPDTSLEWKNASSVIFLNKALKLMTTLNWKISNIDVTMICENPKIKPIKEILSKNLQILMNLEYDQISIKATTTEKMGFLGREEGIGCFATVCLIA